MIRDQTELESIEIKSPLDQDVHHNTDLETAIKCPFDHDIHLHIPVPNNEQKLVIHKMLQQMSTHALYDEHKDWIDEDQCQRFLIARNYHLQQSHDLMIEALKWRHLRQPGRVETLYTNWQEKLSKEAETGKIYIAGNDQWQRPVIVLDNTVQNTHNPNDQMTLFGWTLETATKLMGNDVDKYCVFINLEHFSLFSAPSIGVSIETTKTLSSCFPERLGHCIAYRPPSVFHVLFNAVKGFLDPKTAGKVIFISGDVSEGSANDKVMRDIIGPNWKIITGAEQPVFAPGCSPGYDHSKSWPALMTKIEAIEKKK